jgi:hypothetical protein
MPAGISATLPANVPGATGGAISGASGFWGSVNGQRIVSGSLGMPLLGAWVADVVLASDQPISGPVTLALGNLTLTGAVYRQAPFAGLVEARVVAGAGGWSKTVQARGYDQPSGVLASTVLRDAANEVGETVRVAIDRTVGSLWVRLADKASRTLRALAPSWYIDTAGVTQVGTRPASLVRSDFTAEAFSGASGRLRIATEDPASWLPGATFSSATVGTLTVRSVRHDIAADGKARLMVMA